MIRLNPSRLRVLWLASALIVITGCSAVLDSSSFDFDGEDATVRLDAGRDAAPDPDLDGGRDGGPSPDGGEPECVSAAECASVPGATVACEAGVCVFTCQSLRADCNGDPADGCETDLSDPDTCGACDEECAVDELCDTSGETPTCSFDCPAPGELCGDRRCLDIQTNVDHCGACDQACEGDAATAFVCEAGACRVTECESGRADCNEDPNDGCEVTLADDPVHCGACGSSCGDAVCEHAFCDPVDDVALGSFHACLLRRSGRVQCWGWNEFGEIGDGTTLDRGAPVDVTDNVSALAAGEYVTCAVRLGDLLCWGRGGYGETGIGNRSNTNVPTPVVGAEGSGFVSRTFTDVRAHVSGACALDTTGGIWCWGRNLHGEIGNGAVGNVDRATPVEGLPAPAVELATGYQHTCARLSDDRVFCWGRNEFGQTGNGTTDTPVLAPVEAGMDLDARFIAAGNHNTCALTGAGGLRCWGVRSHGLLGPGGGITSSPTPITVPEPLEEVRISVTAAVARSATQTYTWGQGFDALLGDGVASDALVSAPTLVAGLGAVDALAIGHRSACVLRRGQPICWGWDLAGTVGRSQRLIRPTPVEVAGEGGPITGISAIDAGRRHTCLIAEGVVHCVGSNDQVQLGIAEAWAPRWATAIPLPVVDPPPGQATRVAAGAFFNCASYRHESEDSIWCWGQGAGGTFGPTHSGTRSSPVQLFATSDDPPALLPPGAVVDLQAGGRHACAILEHEGERRPLCWGANGHGQAGQPRTTAVAAPAFVGDITDAVELALGEDHSCVRRASGAVACWGRPLYLGASPAPNPDGAHAPVTLSLVAVEALAAGAVHTCAAVGAGRDLFCWGDNTHGQAVPGTTDPAPTPTDTGLTEAHHLGLGGRHTCLAGDDGVARCFGFNGHGELGDGTTSASAVAVVVAGLDDVIGLTAASAGSAAGFRSSRHTCALRTGGRASCWGANVFGRLGDGASAYESPGPMGVLE